MILMTKIVTLTGLFTVLVLSDTSTEEDTVESVTYTEGFAPELDYTSHVLPIELPTTYEEDREVYVEVVTEQKKLQEAESQEHLEAHLEALETVKKERLEKERLARIEAERIEQERIERERQEAIEREKAIAEAERQKAIEAKKAATEKKEEEVVTTSETSKSVEEPATETSSSSQNTSPVASSYLLAQLVESEAKGEPYEGKVAVAEVVLNRVNSGNFPNSIEGVVYQRGQFQVVSNGSINNAPSESSIRASNEALAGSNYTGGALYFYNPRIATDRWQDTLRTTAVIGNHTFSVR